MSLTVERRDVQPAAPSRTHRRVILAGHAFVGWALCGATMMTGLAVTTVGTAEVVHAIAAPLFFAGLSWNYFKRYGYTTALATAAFFVSFVIAMDVFVVALLIERSFEMFTSPLGTWIPFALIFAATYLTGRRMEDAAIPPVESASPTS